MHINRLRIRNFRNFRNGEFRFESGINTLIGENGSGKSNVLYAIRLLLDGSLPRDPRFRDTDFNRCLSKWKGHWIIISIDFADLDNSEGCQILRHNAAHMNGSNSGTYTLYFRPKKAVRKQLFEASQRGDAAEAFEALLSDIQLDQYELSFTGRVSAR